MRVSTRRVISPLLAVLLPTCLLVAGAALAQTGLDIGGWTLHQENAVHDYVIPAGTTVEPGGYVIIARNVDRAAFESYYGVTLGSNVVFLNSGDLAPMINGDETFQLLNSAGGVEDGPTPAITTTKLAYHRADPEQLAWSSIDSSPDPGSGVEVPDGTLSGMVISEANDPDDYLYEYVELYYDGTTGGGNQVPAISNVGHTPAAPVAGDDVTITATCVDPDGTILSATCWYRAGGGSYLPVIMTAIGGDQYQVTLGGVTGNTLYEYYVSCRDDDNAEVRNPIDAPTTVYSFWVQGDATAGKVILFDHAHDQDAGTTGNWRIDDDYPDPLPANPTAESDWSGQLSSWAYELYLAGHTVRSNTTALSSSLLTGVDLLVIVEPQNPFTAAEIEAVRQFVYAGGSLFVVANHNASDRNGNGWDSPSIFGGYSVPHISDPVGSDTETFCGALFGLHFHVKDEGNNGITGTFTNVAADPSNPVIHGSYGDVAAVIYHVGDSLSLWPTANPDLSDVGALISMDAGDPHVAGWSRYGQGRIVGYGDSSSTADGTGSEDHPANWTEAGSNNREFFLNATMWLLADDATAVGDGTPSRHPGLDVRNWPNPFNPTTTIAFTLPADGNVTVDVLDLQGRRVRTLVSGQRTAGEHLVTWDGRDDGGRPAASGTYLVRATGAGMVTFHKIVLAK